MIIDCSETRETKNYSRSHGIFIMNITISQKLGLSTALVVSIFGCFSHFPTGIPIFFPRKKSPPSLHAPGL